MSVVVDRQAPPLPPARPIERIALADVAGDRLVFESDDDLFRLKAHMNVSTAAPWVLVRPNDARDLAAALVEWADQVGQVDPAPDFVKCDGACEQV